MKKIENTITTEDLENTFSASVEELKKSIISAFYYTMNLNQEYKDRGDRIHIIGPIKQIVGDYGLSAEKVKMIIKEHFSNSEKQTAA